MPELVLSAILWSFARCGRPVRGSSVLLLGAAEASAGGEDNGRSRFHALATQLRALGATVTRHDPGPLAAAGTDPHGSGWAIDDLAAYDCVVVTGDRPACDWSRIADRAKLVVDAAGVMRTFAGGRGHVVYV